MASPSPSPAPRPTEAQALKLGRYVLHGEIASGGMATVYFGRLVGPVGFSRVVAVKRMHPHIAEDPDFVAMFLDEASLAARIQHPNVVSTLDVVAEHGEIFIVMDYVRGESLASLLAAARARDERVPVPVVASLAIGALSGLHAAHEARGEDGAPIGIVHRDVSPQNVLVGLDGLARIVDFGIAKATVRMLESTEDGQVRGKLRYIAPEQLDRGRERSLDRGVDVFAMGVVLWEVLAGRRLYAQEDPAEVVTQLLTGEVPALRRFRTDVSPQLEAVVRRALRREREERFATAAEFAAAIEAASPRVASARAVGEWVSELAAEVLAQREARLSHIESTPTRELDVALVRKSEPGAPPHAGPSRPVTRVHRVPRPSGHTPTTGLLPQRVPALLSSDDQVAVADVGPSSLASRERTSAEPPSARPAAADFRPPGRSRATSARTVALAAAAAMAIAVGVAALASGTAGPTPDEPPPRSAVGPEPAGSAPPPSPAEDPIPDPAGTASVSAPPPSAAAPVATTAPHAPGHAAARPKPSANTAAPAATPATATPAPHAPHAPKPYVADRP